MWWREFRAAWRRLPARLAVVLAAAGPDRRLLAAALRHAPAAGAEGVQDKFAAIDIPPIAAPKGTPTERVAVGMRNALQFDLHNGASTRSRRPISSWSTSATSQYTALSIRPPAGRTRRSNPSARSYTAGRNRDRQDRGQRQPSPMSITTFRARSSVSPDSARGATPKTGRCRSSPRRSGTGSPRISSPAPKASFPPCGLDRRSRLRSQSLHLQGTADKPGHDAAMVALKAQRSKISRPSRPGAAGGAGFRPGRRPGQRTRQRADQGLGRRRERSVLAGAAGRRGARRRSGAAGRGGADHPAVRRPARGVGEGRQPQYRACGRGGARRCRRSNAGW